MEDAGKERKGKVRQEEGEGGREGREERRGKGGRKEESKGGRKRKRGNRRKQSPNVRFVYLTHSKNTREQGLDTELYNLGWPRHICAEDT